MVWVLLIIIGALVIGGLKNPFLGLLGLLCVNIIQPGEIYPLFADLHVERVLALVVLFSLLFHKKLIFPKVTKILLLFWAGLLLGVPFSFWRGGAFFAVLEFGKIIIYHLVIVNLLDSERRFKAFLIVFALLVGWLAGSSAFEYLQGNFTYAQGIDRAVGLTSSAGDPNTLANAIDIGLPLVFLLLFRAAGIARWIAVAVAAVGVYAIILTGSRTAFFGLLFLVVIFMLARRKRIAYLPLAALAVGLLWLATPAEYQQRYMTVSNLSQDASYQDRLIAWRSGVNMFKDYPIFGVGVGQFASADGAKYWVGRGPRIYLNAHSLYVELIAETGMVGILLFGWFLFYVLKLNRTLARAMRERPDLPGWLRAFPAACTFSLLMLLFVGYSSHDLYRSDWYMLGAVTGALQLLVAKYGEGAGAAAVSSAGESAFPLAAAVH